METPEELETRLYLSIMNKQYRFKFTDNEGHAIKCSHCMKALAYANWGCLSIEETIDSINHRRHQDWEPDWIRHTYTLPYKCAACRGTTHSIGDVEHYYYPAHDQDDVDEEGDTYLPRYFTPPVLIFEIPNKCPHELRKSLIKSFQLAYCDISAAANRLRASLEILIKLHFTEAEIGKRILHDQIPLLTNKFATIGNLSLAIKWIGNEGSHGNGEVKEYTLAFAYEAFEKILKIIYGEKKVALEDVASLIVKAKGKL